MSTQTVTPAWPVYGHDWAVAFLQKSRQNHRVRHAYLFTGAQHIGKSTLAHAFAATLQCERDDETQRPCGQCRSCKRLRSGNHPDMIYPPADDKSAVLKIDALREVMRLLALKPFSSRYRIAILENFDSAQERAQDALLKTLEEPPPQAILILLAQSSRSLMATITSRCQILPLRPAPTAAVRDVLLRQGMDEAKADLLAQLSSGRIGWALQAWHDDEILQQRDHALNLLVDAINGSRLKRFAIAEDLSKLDKPALRYVLEMWQTYWRDLLHIHSRTPYLCNVDRREEIHTLTQHLTPQDTLRGLQATRTLLQRTLPTNAAVRLALEVMFLDYPGWPRR